MLEKAEANGSLIKPKEEYTQDEICNLVFISGLSTNHEPNDYSGYGVGMDVIYHNVNTLGGNVKIESKREEGTKVIITI